MSEIKINSQGEVKLFDSDNSNYIGLKAPATVGSNETFILPDADGSANNALKTDGSGNLGFVDVTTLVAQGIDWQSTLKTGDFTAVSGEGYFINTTSGAITATLPASPSAGNIVAFKDYAATFATNNLTVGRNSSNIQGNANDSLLSTNRASVVLVYVDATKGWLYVQESNVQNLGPPYVQATGGTITTSGDFKIHTFTGSGTFTVTNAGQASGSNSVNYLVVAGGASGGNFGGGGGAGGFRTNYPSPATGGLSVSAQAYPITVGAGGASQTGPDYGRGNPGVNAVFSTITSAGGGGGGTYDPGPSNNLNVGISGGSGGGGGVLENPRAVSTTPGTGGAGNTPPVSPPQGSNGGLGTKRSGTGPNDYGGGGGGGGHNAIGADGTAGNGPSGTGGLGGAGGAGSPNEINGSNVTYSGGGGGTFAASGGAGGGGAGAPNSSSVGVAGTTNTGGGGGASRSGGQPSGLGGSGIVIIRYKYQN